MLTTDRQHDIGALMLAAYDRGHEAALIAVPPFAMPAPLSAEWGGESMPELLGPFADDDAVADEYEQRFADGWHAGLAYRLAAG